MELQVGAGVSPWISGGSLSCSCARMARWDAVISVRWRKLPAGPAKLPSCSFSSSRRREGVGQIVHACGQP